MNTRFFRGTLAVFAGALIAFAIIACQMDSSNETTLSAKNETVETFKKVGFEHNEALANYYQEVIQAKAVGKTEAEVFNEFFGNIEDATVIEVEANTGRTDAADSLVAALVANDMVSAEAVTFIVQMETLLNQPGDNLESLIATINAIQNKAVGKLEGQPLNEVLAYAETAKSSLVFWAVNIDELSSAETLRVINPDTETTRRAIVTARKPNIFQRIGGSVASDAAGAVAGSNYGASVARRENRDSAQGGFVGACIAGPASSAAGWDKGKVLVVVDHARIESQVMDLPPKNYY